MRSGGGTLTKLVMNDMGKTYGLSQDGLFKAFDKDGNGSLSAATG